MACLRAKLLLLVAITFCLFTLDESQQIPSLLGQLMNAIRANSTLSTLLRQVNVNTSIAEILQLMRASNQSRILGNLQKALGGINYGMLFGNQFASKLRAVGDLGQCSEDWQRIMNDTKAFAACKFV